MYRNPNKRTMAAIAKRRNVHLVAGMAERSGTKIFNSAILVRPDGLVVSYRKVHLFFEEKLWFDPGDGEFPVYDIGQQLVAQLKASAPIPDPAAPAQPGVSRSAACRCFARRRSSSSNGGPARSLQWVRWRKG